MLAIGAMEELWIDMSPSTVKCTKEHVLGNDVLASTILEFVHQKSMENANQWSNDIKYQQVAFKNNTHSLMCELVNKLHELEEYQSDEQVAGTLSIPGVDWNNFFSIEVKIAQLLYRHWVNVRQEMYAFIFSSYGNRREDNIGKEGLLRVLQDLLAIYAFDSKHGDELCKLFTTAFPELESNSHLTCDGFIARFADLSDKAFTEVSD